MPGHAASWRKANPEIAANCPKAGYSSINPLNDLTYSYIEAYVADLEKVFNSSGATPLLHLGGDEVNKACWEEDTEIKKYMVENNITSEVLW